MFKQFLGTNRFIRLRSKQGGKGAAKGRLTSGLTSAFLTQGSPRQYLVPEVLVQFQFCKEKGEHGNFRWGKAGGGSVSSVGGTRSKRTAVGTEGDGHCVGEPRVLQTPQHLAFLF